MESPQHDLWSEFHDGLRTFILRRVRSEADAEDILQDVFLKVHGSLGSLAEERRLQAWIYRITRNAVIDHYRQRRTVELPTELPDDADADPSDGPRAQLSTCLARFIQRLPPRYREIMQLTELEGLTQEEAAARLGLSLSGAKSRVQRAREQLRQMFSACCHLEFDHRGRLIDYETTERSCDYCCSTPSTDAH